MNSCDPEATSTGEYADESPAFGHSNRPHRFKVLNRCGLGLEDYS